MAEAVARPGWNPLRCGGTALPVHILLMAKLIAIALLLTNHVRLLPSPFLPFVPVLDLLAFSESFRLAVQIVFVGAALALIFNRWVRLASFLLGASILLSVVGSKAYYGNNKTFCACVLLLAGLWHPRIGPWLLRGQLVIVYFGAGLNKLIDPDWQSGVFFDHWAGARLQNPPYLWAAPLLPSLLLAKVFCWYTIFTELCLAAAFCIPRLYPLAIWMSLLFHAGLLEFTGSTFTMFFYAMESAMLVFVAWPRQLTLIFDGDCGICNKIVAWWRRLDFESAFDIQPLQSGAGARWGIAREALLDRLHLAADGRVAAGFRACKLMLLYNPAFWVVLMTLMAGLPEGGGNWSRRILTALLLAFFFPMFDPIGEAVYRWVARNRFRLSGGGACALPAEDQR
jgi:predicted DCC family thiol-disulfide oxidoreductase YuxK